MSCAKPMTRSGSRCLLTTDRPGSGMSWRRRKRTRRGSLRKCTARGCRRRRRWRYTAICFRVTRKGTPLDRLKVPGGSARFSWLFYLRRVARWRRLTWEYFRELDTDDQAAYVAEYEIETKLD